LHPRRLRRRRHVRTPVDTQHADLHLYCNELNAAVNNPLFAMDFACRQQLLLTAKWNLDIDELLRLSEKYSNEKSHFLLAAFETACHTNRGSVIAHIARQNSFDHAQLIKYAVAENQFDFACKLCEYACDNDNGTILTAEHCREVVQFVCRRPLDNSGLMFRRMSMFLGAAHKRYGLDFKCLEDLLHYCPVTKKVLNDLLDDCVEDEPNIMRAAARAATGVQAAANIPLVNVFLERFPEKKTTFLTHLREIYDMSTNYSLTNEAEEFCSAHLLAAKIKSVEREKFTFARLVAAGNFDAKILSGKDVIERDFINKLLAERKFAAIDFLSDKSVVVSTSHMHTCFVGLCETGDLKLAEKIFAIHGADWAELETSSRRGRIAKNILPLVEQIVGETLPTPESDLTHMLLAS
jgi:hypothetical protein